MSIHDAIKSSTDPRELRIAIALADIRLQQLSLAENIDGHTLDARGRLMSMLVRTGNFSAYLRMKGIGDDSTLECRNSSLLIGFIAGVVAAFLAMVL
jgi:hypothetical protein